MTQTPPADERPRFLAACAAILGHHYPATDRELALAALAAAVARTPRDAPLDGALRAFVSAIEPLVGAADQDAVRARVGASQLAAIKRSALSHALQHGPAMALVDSRVAGVDVPVRYLNRIDLRLRVGYGAACDPPIPDLELTEWGWSATLYFQGEPHLVRVPWAALFGVGSEVTRDGVLWDPPEGWDEGEDAPHKPKLGVIDGGLSVESAFAKIERARPATAEELAASEAEFEDNEGELRIDKTPAPLADEEYKTIPALETGRTSYELLSMVPRTASVEDLDRAAMMPTISRHRSSEQTRECPIWDPLWRAFAESDAQLRARVKGEPPEPASDELMEIERKARAEHVERCGDRA